MKFKAKRISVKFDYEFADGAEAQFEYLEPTTELIDGAFEHDGDVAERLKYAKTVLRECLRGERVDDLIADMEKNGNIYEFKAALDTELGKRKRKE